MKKGLLTSIICFSSLVFSSCGSRYVKVTILECTHCSFDNVTQAKLGQDFVLQAHLDRGYELDDRSDSLDIYAGTAHLFYPCFTFNKENNKLTIDKKYVMFGDIKIKGTADVKLNTVKVVVESGTYDQAPFQDAPVSIEGPSYEQEITRDGNAIDEGEISIYPSDIAVHYNEDGNKKLVIPEEDCYTDITITLKQS